MLNAEFVKSGLNHFNLSTLAKKRTLTITAACSEGALTNAVSTRHAVKTQTQDLRRRATTEAYLKQWMDDARTTLEPGKISDPGYSRGQKVETNENSRASDSMKRIHPDGNHCEVHEESVLQTEIIAGSVLQMSRNTLT